MKHIYAPILLVVALAAGIFASCSSESDSRLLEAVPAGATSVAVINLERAAAEGINKGVLPVTAGGNLAVKVSLADGHPVVMAEAPVADSLAAHGFTQSGDPDGAFTAYTDPDGMTAVVNSKNSLVYYIALSAPRALERVAEIAEAAGKLNILSDKGLADYFDKKAGEAVVYGAISRTLLGGQTGRSDDPQGGEWLAYSARQDDGVADVAMSLIYGSGKPVEIKGIQTISPDFLRYVTPDMNVVAAAGLTPDIDWDAAAALVNIIADRTTAGYISAAAPYLKSINGTVAIAIGSDNPSAPSAADSRFLAMAHMDRDKINDFIRQAGMLAAMAGARVESVSPSVSRVVLPSSPGIPSTIYLGEVDGNLVISSYMPDGKAENELAPVMEGHDASAAINFPAGTFPASLIPASAGVEAKFALDGSEAHLRMAFPGSDRSPLAIMSDMIAH